MEQVRTGQHASRQWEDWIASAWIIGALYAQVLVGGGLLIYRIEKGQAPIRVLNIFSARLRNLPRFHLIELGSSQLGI